MNTANFGAQQIVDNFKSFGFKLVVFMDANIARNKMETWITRRATRCDKIFTLNERLKRNDGVLPRDDRWWFQNNGCYFFVGQIFKSCGCTVYYAQSDCDREMVGYYKMHSDRVYGLCGYDSDFFIFDCTLYLEMSSIEFNRGRLRMEGYRHSRVLEHFGLEQRHLPQMAALMGCDVVDRHSGVLRMINSLYNQRSGIQLYARYLRDLDLNQQSKGRGKKSKRQQIECTPNMRKRFKICEDFYAPLFPLGLLDHPYLIMLVFNDHNQSDGKKDEEMETRNGVIVDMCYDDTSLQFPTECSAIVLAPLRGCLYSDLNGCDDETEWNDIVCYPFRKFKLQPNRMILLWRKGYLVESIGSDANPLYGLQSYHFIKRHSITSSDKLRIPPLLIFRDLIFLLSWLKGLCTVEENKYKSKIGKRVKKGTTERDSMWTQYALIEEALIMQWEHRSLFIERIKALKRYRKGMECIAMHFQSIIFGIYEIIFAFLRVQRHGDWIRDLYNGQSTVPRLVINDGNVDQRREVIEKWKNGLRGKTAVDLDIPYCWDVINVKVYHYIIRNIDTARKWVEQSTPQKSTEHTLSEPASDASPGNNCTMTLSAAKLLY